MLMTCNNVIYIDPRVKLLHIGLTIVLFAVVRNTYGAIAIIISNCLIFLFFKIYKAAIGYFSFAAICTILIYLQNNGYADSNTGSIYTIIYIFLILTPIFMTGNIFTKTTQVTDMIAAFRKMKLPYAFVVTFAVTMRFIPTIRYEYSCIRNSMRIRGIGFSFLSFIRNPLRVIEYILVPLMFRSGKVADELSESALTRAIEYPCEKTSLNAIILQSRDYMYLSYISIVFLGVIVWDRL